MPVDDGEVAKVCLPDHIEQIAEQRYCPQQRLDHNVQDHRVELAPRQTEPASFIDDVQRDQGEDGVAGARRQADDAVKPKAKAGAWDAPRGVDKPGEPT